MDENELEVVFAYTRAQALEDGVLIDVSERAKEAGFRYPMAVTRAVWHKCVEPPPNDPTQDLVGRLWDLLNVVRFTAMAVKRADVLEVNLRISNYGVTEDVELKVIPGPGDHGEPVITVMLPDED